MPGPHRSAATGAASYRGDLRRGQLACLNQLTSLTTDSFIVRRPGDNAITALDGGLGLGNQGLLRYFARRGPAQLLTGTPRSYQSHRGWHSRRKIRKSRRGERFSWAVCSAGGAPGRVTTWSARDNEAENLSMSNPRSARKLMALRADRAVQVAASDGGESRILH